MTEPTTALLNTASGRDMLARNRQTVYRYEIIHKDGSSGGDLDGVVDGQLVYDYTARNKTGGKITLLDTGQPIDWLHDRVRISTVVNGITWGLGLYLPTQPGETWANGERAWDVELTSKLLVLDQDAFPTSYSLKVGTNVTQAVRKLITDAGENADQITAGTEKLITPMFWPAGTSRLTIINNLLDASGYFVLRVDGQGNFRAYPYVPPHLRPVSRTFIDGEDCIYLSEFTRDIDIFSVPNRVIAVMQGNDGAEGLVGVASNMNPLDPFSYPSRGRWITNTYTDVDATSQAALNSWAAKTLLDAANPTDVITIKHAPVPLDIYDAVMFGYSLAYPTVHRRVIDQTTIDLDPTGLQTSNLRRVTEYGTDSANQAMGGVGVDTVYLGSGITDGAPL